MSTATVACVDGSRCGDRHAAHGIRRGNADKRRAVEIALREFPKLSSNMIAGMCGVSDTFVGKLRGDVLTVST